MTVLLTGYEPFGDHDVNPSARVARELDGTTVAGERVVGEVLPVDFGRTAEVVAELVADHDPTAVVSTGLAGGREAVSVERVGLNLNDCAGTPDNDGSEPRAEPIDPDGADAHFATLPVRDCVSAVIEAGIPARVSNSAGSHLCNNVLYATRELAERRGLDYRSGFVHLPYLPEQAAAAGLDGEALAGAGVPPSMSLSLQVEAVRTVLETTVESVVEVAADAQ